MNKKGQSNIPDFPGKVMRPPPRPPKYLVSSTVNGDTLQVNTGADEKKAPVLSSTEKKWSGAYIRPINRNSPVDSKRDIKTTPTSERVGNIAGTDVDPLTNVPLYLLEAPIASSVVDGGAAPKISAFERSQLARGDEILLGCDTGVTFERADRRLERYVNVKLPKAEENVCPENPVKALNETWSACWDDQAGAVYYYNNVSGEATWISPI